MVSGAAVKDLPLSKKEKERKSNRKERGKPGAEDEKNGGREQGRKGRKEGAERVAEGHQCTSWPVLQTLGLKGSIFHPSKAKPRTTQQHCQERTSGPWPPDHRTLGLGKFASPKRGWTSRGPANVGTEED